MKHFFLFMLIMSSLAINNCTKKESADCHFYITINNNSSNDIIFSSEEFILDTNLCSLFEENTFLITSSNNIKFRPYPHPDCIESRVELNGNTIALFIVDPNDYTTEAVPCEEFEERNTILRTYILTLEDLERLNYTINYPEDVSIGVD